MTEKEVGENFAVGEFVILTSGAYSDFGNLGWFQALREFSPNTAIAEYRKEHPYAERYGDDEYGFAAWLTKNGWLKEIDLASEWHVGSYGTLFDHDD